METIVLMVAAVMPFAVQSATGLLKRIPVVVWSEHRVLWVRAIVVILSLLGSIFTFMVGGSEVDSTLIENAILAIFTACVATLQHLNAKK